MVISAVDCVFPVLWYLVGLQFTGPLHGANESQAKVMCHFQG